ncbi:hypothetical protein [Treponema primitia]|uniref:hypothetical protein n=1 Tax=Treponema primitia TaxID=88058 RepID=UPI0002555353|nr:hypothetical protein [Treponema primitia]
MKKFLGVFTVLLATGLIAAGGLFAQEVKWNGYVNSGLGVIVADELDDPKLTAFAADAEQWNYRFRLDGAFTNEANTAGANLRFEPQITNAFRLPYFYGWFKVGDILTVNAGIVFNTVFNSGGWILNDDAGEGTGILAVLSPLAGLQIGLGAYVGGWDVVNALTTAPDLESGRYTASLAYQQDNVFKVTASYRTKSYYEVGPIAPGTPVVEAVSYTTGADTAKAILGLQILAVPGLKAVVEAGFDKLDDTFSDNGITSIYETLAYNVEKLDFGLHAQEAFSSVTGQDDPFLRLTPWVSYTIGAFVPQLAGSYVSGGTPLTGANKFKYHRRTTFANSYSSEDSVITLQPSIKYNVDKNTYVELGYVYNIVKEKADIDNDFQVIYADFKWSF